MEEEEDAERGLVNTLLHIYVNVSRLHYCWTRRSKVVLCIQVAAMAVVRTAGVADWWTLSWQARKLKSNSCFVKRRHPPRGVAFCNGVAAPQGWCPRIRYYNVSGLSTGKERPYWNCRPPLGVLFRDTGEEIVNTVPFKRFLMMNN